MDRRAFLKTIGGFSALASLGVYADELASNAPTLQRMLTRQRLFSGFDGKTCKIQPSVAADGEGLAVMGYQKLLLSGSDVFHGQYLTRSTDNGRTWSEPHLAYTRVTPQNGHVFRNRAPIFLARFDPARGGLVRETEFPLVPELGARLGNFCCAPCGPNGFWLVTAEWMQPLGCEKYGSDNSIWLVKLGENR